MPEDMMLRTLRKKSESTGISFQHICQEYAREEALRRVLSQQDGPAAVRGGYGLGLNGMRQLGNTELVIMKPGNDMSGMTQTIMIPVDRVEIPIKVHYEKSLVEAEKFTRRAIPLLGDNQGHLEYDQYPPEAELAENLYESSQFLELIQNMKLYGETDYLLKNMSVNGRQTAHLAEELFREKGESFSKELFGLLEQALRSKQMKKKWDHYVKGNHKKEVDWQQVGDLFLTFYREMWSTLERGEIFLGDWIPEVGRFL